MAEYIVQKDNPNSKKIVLADWTLSRKLFGWISNGDTTYYQPSDENVITMFESDVDIGDPEASQAALDAVSTASEGAWFWDWDLRRIWYKPKSGLTPFDKDNLVIGFVQFRLGNFPGVNADDLPVRPLILNPPPVTMRSGQRFDSELGQTGSGSLTFANDQLIAGRQDLEPDGTVEMFEILETYSGV